MRVLPLTWSGAWGEAVWTPTLPSGVRIRKGAFAPVFSMRSRSWLKVLGARMCRRAEGLVVPMPTFCAFSQRGESAVKSQ